MTFTVKRPLIVWLYCGRISAVPDKFATPFIELAKVQDVLNQSRLALAGQVSARSAIDKLDGLLGDIAEIKKESKT